jgi:cell division septum initiation protein DivIVA
LANILSDIDFTLTFRGYDKEEVDARMHELLSEISLLRQTTKHANSDADSLRNEVAALRRKLKNTNSMGYAELGSQFEQTLRLAEEQAKKLLNDAAQEAIKIRDTAKVDGDAIIRKSEALAAKLITESEQQVTELRLEISTLDNKIATRTSQSEQQANDLLLRSRQEATQTLAASKAEIARLKADASNEIETIREESRAGISCRRSGQVCRNALQGARSDCERPSGCQRQGRNHLQAGCRQRS